MHVYLHCNKRVPEEMKQLWKLKQTKANISLHERAATPFSTMRT
jgi:hypothetical protein